MINSDQIKYPHLVLVVDDQEINRDLLGMILEDEYEVIYAQDGLEALEKIREYQNRLSVVLLDLLMPKMDGFAVLEAVHNDEYLNHIPIIVLTAEKSAELRALQMGASDFITKPFDMHEVIIARVGRIIELSEGRKLISAAEHDQLTGLYNKNFFFEYANRIYQYNPEWEMDAVVMDIEQFHTINALNGRKFGDNILRILGNEIRAFLAETNGIASRFEGDRFDIYCRRQDDYQSLMDRFQNKVNDVVKNANVRLRMGVKPWRPNVEPAVLFDRARSACNMARGNFMTNLVIYDDDMQKRELLSQRLKNELRQAVEEHQFRVVYQPKYNIQYDPPRLSSAEALIRWNHPELGMISPSDFIPLFEGNGQIRIVDNFIWAEAARQIAEWREKYGITIPVSVNLSRVDVFDTTLKDRLIGLVRDNGINFTDLKLEITESAYTENGDQLITLIKQLRKAGFEIEMDDFGSGYSSLNMLSAMPIDILKMDMKFVRNIEYSETDLRLIELVVDIAHYLKTPVIAEGVENERQLALLRGAGCSFVQGYYFSPPVPAEIFEKFIARELKLREQKSDPA